MDTVIRRARKHEAEQAVNDLINRGWTITYPLTEIRSGAYERGEYSKKHNGFKSSRIREVSCWMCKMRKVD